MRIILITFLISFLLGTCYSQDEGLFRLKKHSLSVEILGHSRGLFSLNYELLFPSKSNFSYTLRTGIGYTPGIDIKPERLKGSAYLPLVFSVLLGKNRSHIQLGVSYTAGFGHHFIDSTTTPPSIYQKFESAFIISLGYRYKEQSGLNFQIFPLLQWTNNKSFPFAIGFGLSLGQSF